MWFKIALVSAVYAVGNITMGHFEERTPKLRRLGKYALTLVLVCALSVYFGRAAALSVLGAFVVPLLYVHGYYLPRKNGISG